MSLLTDLLEDVFGPLHGKQINERETDSCMVKKTVADDSVMEDLNSSAESVDHVPSGVRLTLGQNKQQDGGMHANRLGVGGTVGLNNVKTDHAGIIELKLPSLGEFESEVTNSLIETERNVTNIVAPNISNIDLATPSSEDKQTSKTAENDFTNIRDLESVPSSQPKFDLIDTSLDLFDSSATNTTNEPVRAGNLVGCSDRMQLLKTDSETRTLNVTVEENTTDQSSDGVKEFLADSTDLTDIDWSKGVGLKDSCDRPIEPSVLLVPGVCPANKLDVGSTHTGPTVSTNQDRDTHHLNSLSSNQNTGSYQPTGTADVGDSVVNEKAGTEGLTNQSESPCRSRKPLEAMTGQTTLYDLIGSKAVKRPQEAFDLFSKEIRPKG